jgi:hypothetical protein
VKKDENEKKNTDELFRFRLHENGRKKEKDKTIRGQIGEGM